MSTYLNMRPHGTRGLLITFCGLDGCGKSTMINMLREDLEFEGFDVMVTKQPTDMMRKTDIFRTYMDAEDHSRYEYRALSLMAAADRIQHVNQVILPALRAGKIVISDRYFYSCLANLRARGYEDDGWIYEIAWNIFKPDIAFFLDVPVPVAVSRVRSRPEEKDSYIDMDLQYRLYDEYRNIALDNQGVLLSSRNVPELTYKNIKSFVRGKIQ
ncbi:MAG: dTMP kinase [Eubacteriales bacterium]